MPELYFYGSSGIFLLLPLSYVLYRDIINHNVENKESLNQKWEGVIVSFAFLFLNILFPCEAGNTA